MTRTTAKKAAPKKTSAKKAPVKKTATRKIPKCQPLCSHQKKEGDFWVCVKCGTKKRVDYAKLEELFKKGQ